MSSLLHFGQAINAMGFPFVRLVRARAPAGPSVPRFSEDIGQDGEPRGRVAVGQLALASHVVPEGGRGDADVLIRDGPGRQSAAVEDPVAAGRSPGSAHTVSGTRRLASATSHSAMSTIWMPICWVKEFRRAVAASRAACTESRSA